MLVQGKGLRVRFHVHDDEEWDENEEYVPTNVDFFLFEAQEEVNDDNERMGFTSKR